MEKMLKCFYFISKTDRNEEGTYCMEVLGHTKSFPGGATLLLEGVIHSLVLLDSEYIFGNSELLAGRRPSL